MGVYALIVGNVTFPIVVFALNLRKIKECVPSYRLEITKTFLTPLAASLWMAVSLVIVYGLVIASNTVRTLAAILVGVCVYFAAFLLLQGLSKDELFDFPMGRTLYTIARKMHVMK